MQIYCQLKDHKAILENQVVAQAKGYPLVEVEPAYDGSLWEKGFAPEKTIAEKNEKIRAERQARYSVESDPLRLDYDEALARGQDNAEELKGQWLASKDKIREELPYIIGE
jgi:hypothetical protein